MSKLLRALRDSFAKRRIYTLQGPFLVRHVRHEFRYDRNIDRGLVSSDVDGMCRL